MSLDELQNKTSIVSFYFTSNPLMVEIQATGLGSRLDTAASSAVQSNSELAEIVTSCLNILYSSTIFGIPSSL